MHHRASGERSLAPAIKTFVKTRATLKGDGAPFPAAWTNESLRPALRKQERRTTRLVREFFLKLTERAPSRHRPQIPPSPVKARHAAETGRHDGIGCAAIARPTSVRDMLNSVVTNNELRRSPPRLVSPAADKPVESLAVTLFLNRVFPFLCGRHWVQALAGQPIDVQRPKIERAAPGSFAALIYAYMKSNEYRSLRSTTQKHYGTIIEQLRILIGHRSASGLTRERIVKGVVNPNVDKPGNVVSLLKVFRVLVKFGMSLDADNPLRLHHDPSAGIK
jgi:hypothetical protein